MPRKPPADKGTQYDPVLSPSSEASGSRKPATPRAAELNTAARAKKVPKKTAPKAPVSKAAKTAKKATPAKKEPLKASQSAPKKPRKRVAKNPVKLSAAELKALQAAGLHGLDARQAKFIDLWLVTQNARQSYIDAGYTCKNENVASSAACKLLSSAKVQPYLLAKRAELFKRTAEVQDRVLGKIYGAAMADPRELVEFVYKCCRYCHGIDHQYQLTPRQLKDRETEHKRLVTEAKAAKAPAPGPLDTLGGMGYDQNRDPHEDCPECNGNGLGRIVLKDTRHLSPGALSLYGGIKEGKEGIEVKVADQRPYLEMLGRLFNMDVEREAPLMAVVSKDELNEIYARAKERTDAQRALMGQRLAAVAKLEAGSEE